METINIIVFVWSHYRDEQNLLGSSFKKKVIFTRQGIEQKIPIITIMIIESNTKPFIIFNQKLFVRFIDLFHRS